jgi:hypothetical protein
MPFIKSKSLGAPGSIGGAMEGRGGRARGFGKRTRFLGLRLVEAISLDDAICDKQLQQSERRSRTRSQSRVLICTGDFVHMFFKNSIQLERDQADTSD